MSSQLIFAVDSRVPRALKKKRRNICPRSANSHDSSHHLRSNLWARVCARIQFREKLRFHPTEKRIPKYFFLTTTNNFKS